MFLKKYFYLSTGAVVALMSFRFFYTGTPAYVFLFWNLFLAWIPYGIGNYYFKEARPKNATSYLILLAWVLFLPNAPYIITDVFHLHNTDGMPKYYDLVLLMLTAIQGLVYFFASLIITAHWWQHHHKGILNTLFHGMVFLLCGYGIYLGRYGRFNSWDIISNPLALFKDFIQNITSPIDNKNTWGVTIVFALFFYVLFGLVKYALKEIQYKKPSLT